MNNVESDVEFVERMIREWDAELVQRVEDYDRLFVLARRGVEMTRAAVAETWNEPTVGYLENAEKVALRAAMKLKIDEKQFLAAVDHEGDHEVGAGKFPDDMRAFSAFTNNEDVYAAAREEYRKKIAEQAQEIERLRAALREIAKTTYGYEPYMTDEEAAEYFKSRFFAAQAKARAALGGRDD